ncbi:MAG: hypothetical protein IJU76_02130 [Desulfovibrionaceae bacterium]|nr:hypothetical protein [Desulfovibrionaceae bacterium]
MDITSNSIQTGFTSSGESLLAQSIRQTQAPHEAGKPSKAADQVSLSPEAMESIRVTIRETVQTSVQDALRGTGTQEALKTGRRRARPQPLIRDDLAKESRQTTAESTGQTIAPERQTVTAQKETSSDDFTGTPSEAFVALSQNSATEKKQTALIWANGTYHTQYQRTNRFYFSQNTDTQAAQANEYSLGRAARTYATTAVQGMPQTGLAPYGTGISRYI